MKKRLTGFAVIALSAALLGGCSAVPFSNPAASAKLVNTQEIPMDGVERVEISYRAENITLLESDSDQIVLKEYMSAEKPEYAAAVNRGEETLTITAGARPKAIVGMFESYVELYLPADYHGSLVVETRSGNIDAEQALSLAAFQADSRSGAVTLAGLTAEDIGIETGSGPISCGTLSGAARVETQSGGMEILEYAGPGHFTSESGEVRIGCGAVEDLRVDTQSGSVALSLPRDLEFDFSADTRSGKITTPFSDQMEDTGETVRGTVGAEAEITIACSTESGNIKVTALT